ncbi:MAG: hypothetical protein JWM90_114 [Thermoleophilia bacterium]|nr:hypothetical protein [Thermoleophilia bacterium]
MTQLVAASIQDQAADLRPEVVAILGALAAFLVVCAIGVQLSARRRTIELRAAEEELVDRDTGLLPRSAVRVRLGAELAWASTSRTPISVAIFRVRGSRFVRAAHVLRQSMREEEQAFLLRDQHIAVELWGADADAAAAGVARIGADLVRAGHPVVDAGIACSPRDGSDVDTLLAAARRDLRPIDDPLEDHGTRHRTWSATRHQGLLLRGILPWFALLGLVLCTAWRLLPAAIDASLTNQLDGADLLIALVAAIGIPIGAAFVHASAWNLGGGPAPRSRPVMPAGWRALGLIATAIGIPLAWGIFLPDTPGGLSEGFGASLALLALVVLVLLQARQLVHVAVVPLVAVLLLGAGITWVSIESWDLPVLANAGRLLAAAALGALFARCIERASWLVMLAVLVSAVDIWSVTSESGVTNDLLEGDGGGRLLDLLLFTGPVVQAVPLFEIGVTDLVFLALILCWSADWRVDLRLAVPLLVGATWVALLAVELSDRTLPLLPFLAAAMLVVTGIRSLRLRAQSRRWHTTSAPA